MLFLPRKNKSNLPDIKFSAMNSNKQIHITALLILSFIAVFTTSSCGDKGAPDVSGIKIDLETKRLDKDLYTLDTNHLGEGLAKLHEAYPDFLDFYLDTLMGFNIVGNYVDTEMGIQKGLRTFLTHKDYRGVFDTVLKRFPDEQPINEELTKGFQYAKHYFPDYKTPRIIYIVSGLNNYGALTFGSNTVAVGLDMFLGANYPFYRSVGIPDYFAGQLNEKYIPVAVFRTIFRESNPFITDGRVLLDMMIQSGKEMYFVKKLLPFVDEHTRLAYTPEQLAWCEQNEAMVYDFFARQQLFYDNNLQKVIRYVMDGPNATGMPSESPGNIGAWLGLQIVESYMKQYPEKTLKELITEPIDAQRFLSESKYKPK